MMGKRHGERRSEVSAGGTFAKLAQTCLDLPCQASFGCGPLPNLRYQKQSNPISVQYRTLKITVDSQSDLDTASILAEVTINLP